MAVASGTFAIRKQRSFGVEILKVLTGTHGDDSSGFASVATDNASSFLTLITSADNARTLAMSASWSCFRFVLPHIRLNMSTSYPSRPREMHCWNVM